MSRVLLLLRYVTDGDVKCYFCWRVLHAVGLNKRRGEAVIIHSIWIYLFMFRFYTFFYQHGTMFTCKVYGCFNLLMIFNYTPSYMGVGLVHAASQLTHIYPKFMTNVLKWKQTFRLRRCFVIIHFVYLAELSAKINVSIHISIPRTQNHPSYSQQSFPCIFN